MTLADVLEQAVSLGFEFHFWTVVPNVRKPLEWHMAFIKEEATASMVGTGLTLDEAVTKAVQRVEEVTGVRLAYEREAG